MPSFYTERLSFVGSQGYRLDARLESPLGQPACFALFAHCFTCSKDYIAPTRISRALAERGIATLRFDFTGLGQSEGDFAGTNFSSNIGDITCAADYLRERYQAPKILIGHSLGGAAIVAAAGKIPESTIVATIAAPSDPAQITQAFAEQIPEIERSGEAVVRIVGRSFRIRRQFLDDVQGLDLRQALADLDRALLVFHSPQDAIVEIKHAQRMFAFARYPKNFVLLDQADHLLTRKEDAQYVAGILAAWAARFIHERGQREAPRRVNAHDGVIVSEAETESFVQHIDNGRHRLIADEPREYGGADAGFTPYELLLASLGACTSMTIRMYARRKQLPLRHVEVRLRHARIHARDCEECETDEGRVDRIERTIVVQGDLTNDQRKSLLAIADKCPVHRTLQGEILVTTRLRNGSSDKEAQ